MIQGIDGEALIKQAAHDLKRLGCLDERLVSRDRRAIREKIETESKIRKWLRDLTRLTV